jgi:sterol desaturase/sphingolipid hydroxylase (fatty acid hydroxylase superfamily)
VNVASLIALFAITGCLLTTAEWVNPIEFAPRAQHKSVDAKRPHQDWPWFFVYLAYAPLVGVATVRLTETISRVSVLAQIVGRGPLLVQSLGGALVCEFVAYGMHRLMHRVPLLWRFHAVHHGSRDPRWYTAFRFHPIDGVLSTVVPVVAAACLGFDRAALSVYLSVVFVTTLFAHANVWFPGRWVSELVSTPDFHRRHHDTHFSGTNFALVLPVLDRIFGSRAPAVVPATEAALCQTATRRN